MKHLAKKLIAGWMMILLVTTACSDSVAPPDPKKELPRTDIMTITSDFVIDNYAYPIKVYLPATFETNVNLPVIYVLDGEVTIDIVINALGSNIEAIVVGIGDFSAKQEWNRRVIDFMPATIDTNCGGTKGNHLDFYNFISKELVPRIDSRYPNDHSSRTIIGHSLGGIFTFVSMFMEDPENVLFHNFISIDTGFNCDTDFFAAIMQHDYNFPVGAKTFKYYFAMAFGGGMDAKRQFAENVQAKEYSWLSFKFEEFLDEDHNSVRGPSIKSGLAFIYE